MTCKTGFIKGTVVGLLSTLLFLYESENTLSQNQIGRDGTSVQGQAVPRDVREIYDRGLSWLENNQDDKGTWKGTGGEQGAGSTGLAIMAFLASGEDPNFGKYSIPLRKALQALIREQNSSTGYFGGSMYHHGFATLALAEAYGAIDERNFWPEGMEGKKIRSIGQSLELAVRTSITSQDKNTAGGWRYSPDANDWHTCVTHRLPHPISFSTSPRAQYTHWKQTVFYLRDPLQIRSREQITGSFAMKPNVNNARDLDIAISLELAR